MNVVLSWAWMALLAGAWLPGLASAQTESGTPGMTWHVRVSAGRMLSGTAVGLDALKVKTTFGEVTIPMDKIAGIQFKTGAAGEAVIAFRNGDLVTGQVSLDLVTLNTEWGTARIDPQQVDSMLTDPESKFVAPPAGRDQGWRFLSAGNR